MKIKLLSLLVLFLFTSSFISAQEQDTPRKSENPASSDSLWEDSLDDSSWADEDWDNWELEWEDEWKEFEDEYGHFRFKGQPSISISYGFSKLRMKNLKEQFTHPASIELKLGYFTEKSLRKEEAILQQKVKYFHLSNINSDLGDKNSTDIKTNIWKLGLGSISGMGYNLGNSALIFNYGYSLDWTRIDVKSTPTDSIDASTLALFDKTFRFGTTWQGGIQFRFIPQVGIEASYERSVIFPRHLFWKWLGSIVVESAGQILIDKFVSEITESSPFAAPIVNFLLKNALSYGFYELRREKGHWPFNSPVPVEINQFKVGLTFIF